MNVQNAVMGCAVLLGVAASCGDSTSEPLIPVPIDGTWLLNIGSPVSGVCTQGFGGGPGAGLVFEPIGSSRDAAYEIPFIAHIDFVDEGSVPQVVALYCLIVSTYTEEGGSPYGALECSGQTTSTFQPNSETDAAWLLGIDLIGPFTEEVPCTIEQGLAESDFAAFADGSWSLSLIGDCMGSECTNTEPPTDEFGEAFCIQSLELSGRWEGCGEGEDACRLGPVQPEDDCR